MAHFMHEGVKNHLARRRPKILSACIEFDGSIPSFRVGLPDEVAHGFAALDTKAEYLVDARARPAAVFAQRFIPEALNITQLGDEHVEDESANRVLAVAGHGRLQQFFTV